MPIDKSHCPFVSCRGCALKSSFGGAMLHNLLICGSLAKPHWFLQIWFLCGSPFSTPSEGSTPVSEVTMCCWVRRKRCSPESSTSGLVWGVTDSTFSGKVVHLTPKRNFVFPPSSFLKRVYHFSAVRVRLQNQGPKGYCTCLPVPTVPSRVSSFDRSTYSLVVKDCFCFLTPTQKL